MPITIPKPNLLIPKVPSVLVAGLLVAQFLFFQVGHGPEPKCTLNVERPHYSTSLKEVKDIDAIKLNIPSLCNVPQIYTQVCTSIQRIENNKVITAYKFEKERRNASASDNRTTLFRDLFVPCVVGISALYRGEAQGYIYLESGKKYPVKSDSGNFAAEGCLIGAQ